MADLAPAPVAADPAPSPSPPPAPAAAAAPAPAADPAKPAEPAAAGTSAPFEASKLTLPEGFTVDPKLMEQFSGTAKELGLSQEGAQKLVNLQAETLKEVTSSSQKQFTEQQTAWQTAVKADPEIGGEKLPGVVQTIAKAIDQFGTPGLKDMLNNTGAGNNPDMIKFLYKMASQLTEGSPARGNPPGQSPQGGFDGMAARMYPSMKQG